MASRVYDQERAVYPLKHRLLLGQHHVRTDLL